MTIQTQTNKGQFPGNGAQTVFNCAFLVQSASQLQVVTTDTSGNQTTITQGPALGQYQVTGLGVASGFTLTYQQSTGPLPTGWLITVLRQVPYVQLTSLVNQNAFFQQAVEGALDYVTMALQQFVELVGRSPVLPVGTSTSFNTTLPTPVPNAALAINSAGTGFSFSLSLGSVSVPVAINQGGTGATTAPQALINLGANPFPWTVGPVPTFVNPTKFTLVGDQTLLFEIGRQLKTTVSGVSVYGYVQACDFNISSPGLTTVTMGNGTAALTAGLTGVSYGTEDAINPAVPLLQGGRALFRDPTDGTKSASLILAGISTGFNRALTVQNASGSIALTTEFAYAGLAGTNGRLILPPWYIAGFQLTNNGATGYDVGAGYAMDSTNAFNMVSAAGLANKTQLAWVAGPGGGGKLSAAAMANGTWYYWYAIRKDSDGSLDFGFDVSATTPTMPGGYTAFRILGGRKTQPASTNWETHIQHGDEVFWSTPPALDASGVASTANRTLVTVNAPAYKLKWMGNASVLDQAASNGGLIITDPACADVAPAITASPLASVSIQTQSGTIVTNIGAQVSCWTDSTPRIGVRGIAAQNTEIQTIGWWDPRGRPV